MKQAALLDTNVLLALAWPSHQHHSAAHGWFGKHAAKGWATCAFTQLGFIRLSSNRAFTPDAVAPREAASLLREWIKLKGHAFWESPAAVSGSIFASSIGHQQVNDAWLVEVARQHHGRLVTFDQRVVAHVAPNAKPRIVEVIKS